MLASLLTLRPLHRLALLLLLAPSALLLSALTFAAPALERTGPAALPTLVLEPLATGFMCSRMARFSNRPFWIFETWCGRKIRSKGCWV